ncbi:unnamed protein product [Cochlearia groenlandica]
MISGKEVEPPQKRTKLPSPSLQPPFHNHQQQPCLSFTSLPDEIALNCFARMSKHYYPSLSIVSKTFLALLSSPDLYVERSHIGNTEICLYLCLKFSTVLFTAPTRRWFTLWLNPRPNYGHDGRFKEKSKGNLFVPFPPSPPPPYSNSTVTIGSEIYLFGGPPDDNSQPSSAVRVYDCRNHTWRDLPNMKRERIHPSTCLLNDKIYVMGGCRLCEENWFEVFDLKTQTWKTLASFLNPNQRMLYKVGKIGAVEGKIYVKAEIGHYNCVYDVKDEKWSVADVNLSHLWSSSWCVIENVMYCYSFDSARYLWYDTKGRAWRDVKGLKILRKFRSFSSVFPHCMVELVNYGGKLAVLWDKYERRGRSQNKNVWCAVVRLERYWPGGMVVGKIEWFGVVLTVPKSYNFVNCLAVSI